jgi:flagellar biogenesis protein FliO
MSAKTITATLPDLAQASPLFERLSRAVHLLVKRLVPAANSAERTLAVEDRVTLGPKKSLVVVRCRGQRFLIAISADTFGPMIELAPSRPARRTRTERPA